MARADSMGALARSKVALIAVLLGLLGLHSVHRIFPCAISGAMRFSAKRI